MGSAGLFGCGKTVKDLTDAGKKKTATDPTRIFHQTQLCIAQKSCALRCAMDNCKWMDIVIPDFVGPYLQKTGGWLGIEGDCKKRGTGTYSDLRCAEQMARHHIFNDLRPAVERSGCGSDADWTTVFEVIGQCTQQSFGNPALQTMAASAADMYRSAVRGACVLTRTIRGDPLSINDDLKGKVCVAP